MSRPTVVLHTSLLRFALQVSGPLLLLGVVWQSVRLNAGELPVGGAVVGVVALALLLVVLLDVPHRVEIDAEGVTRVCLLRRQRVAWSTVTAVVRLRGDLGGGATRTGDDEGRSLPQLPRRRGGLVLRVGKRKHLTLVERPESHAEWTAIRELLRDRATAFSASEPPVDATPAGRGPRALHRGR